MLCCWLFAPILFCTPHLPFSRLRFTIRQKEYTMAEVEKELEAEEDLADFEEGNAEPTKQVSEVSAKKLNVF